MICSEVSLEWSTERGRSSFSRLDLPGLHSVYFCFLEECGKVVQCELKVFRAGFLSCVYVTAALKHEVNQ